MAGRLSRRSAARQDEDGARAPARGEAQDAARRSTTRSRASVGDFESLACSARPPCARTSRSTPLATPTPPCASSSSTRSSAPTRSTCRRAGCAQLIDAYAEAYQIPDEEQRQVRRRVPPGGRASGAARPDHRHDRRQRKLAQASEADIDERVAEWPPSAAPIPGQVYASLQKAGRLREIEQKHHRRQSVRLAAGTKRSRLVHHRHQEHRLMATIYPPVRHRALAPRRAELRHLLAVC